MAGPNVRVPRSGGHNFREVPRATIPRSTFDLSHSCKTTFDADELIPIYVEEILPGDTYNVQMNGLCRIFSPLQTPVMDNMYLETFWFFVPNRIIWDNWQKFCGEQTDPGDSTDYTIPRLSSGTAASAGSLSNYMGLPIGVAPNDLTNYNALPYRAYHTIYNEWFRDQNLVDSIAVPKDNGPDSYTGHLAKNTRAKRHDYFTSCLPWPVKTDDGSEVTALFPVSGIGKNDQVYSASGVNVYETGESGTTNFANAVDMDSATNNVYIEEDPDNLGFPGIFAGVTINTLRQAIQIQRLRERDARSGTRYVEILKAHFGVTSPDARLQRPEYLGGGRTMVNVTPVANTSSTATEDQGQLAGVGASGFGGHGFVKSFVEHGYVIGIANVRADITYHQGVHRMWSRQTRFEFFWPALSGLGEQAVLNQEIWVSGVTATDEAVFGYIPRWDEYRHGMSRVSGYFAPDAAGAISEWHLAEDFATLPALNQTFIESNTPMDRVKAVTTAHDFLLDAWIQVRAARPLPTFGVPGMMDHF